MTFLDVLAVLFILYIVFLIGRRAAQDVPDEIFPVYQMLAADALLLLMTGVFFWYLHQPILAIIIPLGFALLRFRLSFERARIVVGGVLVAGGSFLGREAFVTLAILCLVMNFVHGMLGDSLKNLAFRTITQPIAGVLGFIVLYGSSVMTF